MDEETKTLLRIMAVVTAFMSLVFGVASLLVVTFNSPVLRERNRCAEIIHSAIENLEPSQLDQFKTLITISNKIKSGE